MLDSKKGPGPPKRLLLLPSAQQPAQQRLMVAALALLVLSLGMLLYADRDFWFPDSEVATEQPVPPSSTATATAPTKETQAASPQHKKGHRRVRAEQKNASPVSEDQPVAPMTVTRTVLPPLEVEVVAGSARQTVHPGTTSVKVDMQPSAQESGLNAHPGEASGGDSIATNAAERTPLSAEPQVVAHSVKPGYPLLARQMKVQGAVILLALIGRDGLIQNLNVVSGPPILATAAREAVKQWHFKPHYEGAEAVETQAKITVNFTISTN